MEHFISVSSPLLAALHRIGSSVADGAELIFSAHSRVGALHHLLATDDAKLSARGLTRDGEIARILGDRR